MGGENGLNFAWLHTFIDIIIPEFNQIFHLKTLHRSFCDVIMILIHKTLGKHSMESLQAISLHNTDIKLLVTYLVTQSENNYSVSVWCYRNNSNTSNT